MGSREGITGTGNRHYAEDPALLRGVLASEKTEIPERDRHVRTPESERCEHGKKLGPNLNCKDCAWLYGWEKREAT